jgi:ribonuclease D
MIPILTTTRQIEELAAQLAATDVIAVDLEADSMHSYREKVCLLQFSTATHTWLVDPLPGADLSSLQPVLADPAVRKIFHAADYDIRSLYRDFGLEIHGLFDTMIASQFVGEEKIGLNDLLGKYFEVVLDKQYQRADWSVRPLSEGMIRYAAEDTRHLHRLAQLLEEKLAALGRLEWAAEEFALAEAVRAGTAQEGPMFLRFKGAAAFDRRQLAILEGLLQWRDGEARRRDIPPFKVLGNATLQGLAHSAPRELAAMDGIEGLPARLVERYGRPLLEVVEKALALPEDQLPVYPRSARRERDAEVDKRMTKLKDWRRRQAEELQIDPGIVINNTALEELARRQPRDEQGLRETGLKQWQQQVLGEGILRALREGGG